MPTAQDVYSNIAETSEYATTLPTAAYLDDQVFDDEVRHVLRPGWYPVARSNDIADPGSFRSVDVLGDPLVVTRDSDGTVHVLSRVCRHRAMPVAEGSGKAKSFSCPYHLWRYGLDGKFLAAPGMEHSKAFNPQTCNLPSIRHEEWEGWIFANLSGDAAPLAPQLSPLTERLKGIQAADLVTIGVLEFESPWNWKVMVENFLESYHHIGTHTETLQQTNPGLGTYCSDLDGAFTVLENPEKDNEADPFIVANVFPLGLMFFSEGDVCTGGWFEFSDLEKDRFFLRIHLFLPKQFAQDKAITDMYLDRIRAVHTEDIEACMGIQKGLKSAFYQTGPMSHLENCNWRFHRYLQSCFTVK